MKERIELFKNLLNQQSGNLDELTKKFKKELIKDLEILGYLKIDSNNWKLTKKGEKIAKLFTSTKSKNYKNKLSISDIFKKLIF